MPRRGHIRARPLSLFQSRQSQMIRHMRHGSSFRLMVLQPICVPDPGESPSNSINRRPYHSPQSVSCRDDASRRLSEPGSRLWTSIRATSLRPTASDHPGIRKVSPSGQALFCDLSFRVGSPASLRLSMSVDSSTLTVNNKQVELAVKDGTIGPSVLDISKLYAQTGMFTYDPGFTSTAACESAIMYIDGDAGVLLYRGYPIDQLAEHGDFLETCYLLLYGELPTASQKADFDYRVTRHTMVHEQMMRFFQGFRRDAHPMAIMVACVGALSAFYHDSTDIFDPYQRMVASMRMIAKTPTLAAMAYKYSAGQPFVYPKNDLDYTSNVLRMCFAVPTEDYKVNPVLARALDRIFILHADHEQNASTSTVRLAGSSGANPFACIAAGIACLWGPAHGGANEAALQMLQEIGTPDNVAKYVAKAKDKNDP